MNSIRQVNDNRSLSHKTQMMAMVTTGHGGVDKLDYRTVPIPTLQAGEVLLRVLAAGVNNTDINTRLGWYSKSVVSSTHLTAEYQEANAEQKSDGGWNNATAFPIIQGTDCCGEVVLTANENHQDWLGKRVLVRPCIRLTGFNSLDNIWLGSDFDGAFAQYVKVPASEIFAVDCNWSNEELATIPCAYGTAENMLHRGCVTRGERVFITGASGGVGSATIQLAKRRGAYVIAMTSPDKVKQIAELGADVVVSHDCDLQKEIGENKLDVVVDNVAGPGFGQMLKLLKRGGRYLSSGAIAGPIVELDMRDLYLNDITLIGCTAWEEPVFPNLISYIERGEIRPILAKVYPLEQIAIAQQEFMKKTHIGKFVLVP